MHVERAVALDGADDLSVRRDAQAEAQTAVPFRAVVHCLFLYDAATRRAMRRLP